MENRTGGAGNIGIDAVRRATPDGTTLLVIPAGNLTINPTLMRNLPFDVERDFAPITMLATAPNLLVASPKLGIKTIPELIEKAKQGKIRTGSPGIGSQLHLAVELFKQKTGAEIVHVPYRGTGPALNDVLGGHLELMVSNLPAVLSAIRAGTVVPLAMTTAERSPVLPDVPTLIEEAGGAGHRRDILVRLARPARHAEAGARRDLDGDGRYPEIRGAAGEARRARPQREDRAVRRLRRAHPPGNRNLGRADPAT